MKWINEWVAPLLAILFLTLCIIRFSQYEESRWNEDKIWFRCEYTHTEAYETIIFGTYHDKYECINGTQTRTRFKWFPE